MLAKCVVVWITTSLFVTSAATATERSQTGGDQRIYVPGGRPVQLGEFPFLALLKIATYYDNTTCSGSIPSPTTVLTAAHCHLAIITAYAGLVRNEEMEQRSANVQVRHVKAVAKPAFSTFSDIMVCYVNESWVWTESVAPVALHLSEVRLQPSFVISCQVLGFGVIGREGTNESFVENGTHDKAHVMDQLIGSGSQCMDTHFLFFFFSFWMCSVNVDYKTVCEGDDGGPVVCDGQQWAVTKGAAPSNRLCAPQETTANAYVLTGYFRSWILDKIPDLPSSADSIHRYSSRILKYEALLNQPLWLLLLMTVELLYLL